MTECIYCHHDVAADYAPLLSDDAAWAEIAAEHAQHCEWVRTRAHRLDPEGVGPLRLGPTARSLARELYRDDMSRADEVPVQRDGHKAYDGWLQASSDAGDRETKEALEAVDRDAFARAWEEMRDETAA